MKKIHMSYCKFLLSLVIIVVICMLKEDAALVRTLLYIIMGGVLTVRIRREKVTVIEYLALAVLVYINISLFFPVLIPVKGVLNAILKTGGLYSILIFLTGALAGYIIVPSSEMKKSA